MNTDPACVLAADIGATSMRAAVVDLADGTLLARDRVPTEAANGFDEAAARLGALLARVRDAAGVPVAALGVSTAGPLDPRDGRYQHPPNLPGWHGRSMREPLAAALGVPVRVGHDATLAALAETRFGARRGATDLVYLTVSTGIGAGIVAGGRVVTGRSGGAGEAGHLIVNPGGRACAAGCPGCLEGQSSGSAIAAMAIVRLGEALTAAEVFARADAGDAAAAAVVDEAVGHLASGIAGLLALLDPDAVILGGGVAQGLVGRWEMLCVEVRRRALPRYTEDVPVELTTLGDDASLLGAAMWAQESGPTAGKAEAH
jgi:glucokinase